MQNGQTQYPFEENFRKDLSTYLQGRNLTDKMLPEAADIEEKWQKIAEA